MFVLIIGLALGGCASPTVYQPYRDSFWGTSGGYTDTKLQEGVYRVNFTGNDDTDTVRTADFAMLRAAEVALRDGYSYFLISTERTETMSNVAIYSRSSWPSVYNMPISSFVVQCFKEKPETTAIVYDAEAVRKNIRAQYGMPDPAQAAIVEKK